MDRELKTTNDAPVAPETAGCVSGALPAELEAIKAVVEEQGKRRSGSYRNETERVGRRLQEYLVAHRMTLKAFVAANTGQEICGTESDPRPRPELMGVLRGILEELCEKGHLALAFDRCFIPADGLDRHMTSRGLEGFPEALTGVLPGWLIPERFMRGIKNNAGVPPAVREEMAVFAQKSKRKLNEKSQVLYWGTARKLAKDTAIKSLKELQGPEGAAKLHAYIEAMKYDSSTSTVVHIRHIFHKLFGEESPFKLRGPDKELLIQVPEPPLNPVIKEGSRFRKNKKRHEVIGGVVMECRIRSADLKRMVQAKDQALDDWRKAPQKELGRLFREAQENELVKYWAIIKDRPAELRAHNVSDIKLVEADANSPDSQALAGDGYILNNYRESTKKSRPDKPFPKFMGKRLNALWLLRRAFFKTKGDCDLKPSKEIGILRVGVPLFVDPRTGQRASDGAILEMLRRGLLRTGMDPEVVDRVSGYWLRKGVISTEWEQGKLKEFTEKTNGHKIKTAHSTYITEEIVPWVVHERETYWKFLGINRAALDAPEGHGTGPQALGAVKETARKLLEQLKGQVPGLQDMTQGQLDALASSVTFDGDGRLTEKETAKLIGKSKSTVLRWVELGLLEKFREAGRVFYLKSQVRSFLETFSFLTPAAKIIGVSSRYLRRQCSEGKISGAKQIGGKSYLIPWTEVRARAAARSRQK